MDKKTRATIIKSQLGFAVLYVLLKYVWIGFENIIFYEVIQNLISMGLISIFIIGISIVTYNGVAGMKIKNEIEKKNNTVKAVQKA